MASEVPRRSGGLPSGPVCELGAEETLRHFLKNYHGLGGIREIHRIKEANEVEELQLFGDQDKKKIEKTEEEEVG